MHCHKRVYQQPQLLLTLPLPLRSPPLLFLLLNPRLVLGPNPLWK
jgi:hypothetical protein